MILILGECLLDIKLI